MLDSRAIAHAQILQAHKELPCEFAPTKPFRDSPFAQHSCDASFNAECNEAVDPRIAKSWQFQAVRNVGAAAVLLDLKAEHLHTGECPALCSLCLIV